MGTSARLVRVTVSGVQRLILVKLVIPQDKTLNTMLLGRDAMIAPRNTKKALNMEFVIKQ